MRLAEGMRLGWGGVPINTMCYKVTQVCNRHYGKRQQKYLTLSCLGRVKKASLEGMTQTNS